MGSKGNFFILLVIIAVLALALSALVGYLFFMSGSGNSINSDGSANTIKVPTDSELSQINVYDEDTVLNLKGEQGKKADFIQLNITLSVFKEAKVKGYKTSEEKVTAYLKKIREVIATYFQKMSRDEAWLSADIAKERAKKDLKESLNQLLIANEKDKEEIIYEIIFDKWFCP